MDGHPSSSLSHTDIHSFYTEITPLTLLYLFWLGIGTSQEKDKVLFLFFISYVQLMSEALQHTTLHWESWWKSTVLSEDETRIYQQEISKAINMQEDPHLISANFYFPNRH